MEERALVRIHQALGMLFGLAQVLEDLLLRVQGASNITVCSGRFLLLLLEIRQAFLLVFLYLCPKALLPLVEGREALHGAGEGGEDGDTRRRQRCTADILSSLQHPAPRQTCSSSDGCGISG